MRPFRECFACKFFNVQQELASCCKFFNATAVGSGAKDCEAPTVAISGVTVRILHSCKYTAANS